MYGPKFAIFQSGEYSTTSLSLKEIIKQQPESSSSAVTYLHGICDRGIEKGLFSFSYFQELLWEFMENADSKQLQDMIPSLVDHAIHLLSTRAGAKVAAYCAAYGSPKDRRKLMKNLKGYTKSSLLHKDAYITIIRLLDVTDDTVAIQKNILAELIPNQSSGKADEDANMDGENEDSPLLEVALSDTGSKLFLYLLGDPEKQKHFFDPFELELLKPATVVDKESGETVSTSKKNPETRRRELSQYMKQSIFDLCITHTEELMRDKNGSKIIGAVFNSNPSDCESLASQIVQTCDKDDDENEEEKSLSLFEDPIAHLLIKRLINSDAENESKEDDDTSTEPIFSSTFAKKYKGRLMEIASTNRGAFILAALAKIKNEEISTIVKNELKVSKNLKTLKQRKKEKGFEALLKEL